MMKTMLAILLAALLQGKPVELLSKAEIAKDSTWKNTGKALVVDAAFPVREIVTFDAQVPEEYDLMIVLERMDDSKKDFAIGLPFGETTCAYHFDTWDGTKNSVALMGGQEGESVPGQTFKKGRPRTAKFSVRKDGLTVELDGKKFWKGKVAWAKASTVDSIKVEKSKLFLVAAGGQWKVSAFVLTPAR